MSTDIQIEPNGQYLRVVAKGQQTYDNLYSGWKQILETSRRHGLSRILCESCREGKTSTSDIYLFGKDLARLIFPISLRIAFLCSYEDLHDMHLIEVVLSNRRNLPTAVFTDRDEALHWLMNDL